MWRVWVCMRCRRRLEFDAYENGYLWWNIHIMAHCFVLYAPRTLEKRSGKKRRTETHTIEETNKQIHGKIWKIRRKKMKWIKTKATANIIFSTAAAHIAAECAFFHCCCCCFAVFYFCFEEMNKQKIVLRLNSFVLVTHIKRNERTRARTYIKHHIPISYKEHNALNFYFIWEKNHGRKQWIECMSNLRCWYCCFHLAKGMIANRKPWSI